ncbi:unnamed protein product, partial [Ixodes hexagonus]
MSVASYLRNTLYRFSINSNMARTPSTALGWNPSSLTSLDVSSRLTPFSMLMGSLRMASGFSFATSSMFTPPWDDATIRGP